MKYGLKRLVLGSASILPITLAQYNEIKRARLMIREGLYLEQKFDFLVANYMEFESALLESAIHEMVLGGQDYNWFAESRASFDRRIMNLLTTARTYTDSVPQHVNQFFDRNPEKTSIAEGYFSTEYDGRIGYRTMCALRNFVQHQGFPVHGSAYGASRVGEGEERKMRFTVDPYLRPAELREGNFKKTVLVELESMGKEIDLKFLMRDFVEGLSTATSKLREMIDATIKDAASVLEAAIKSFEDEFPSEGSIIGLAAVRVNANQNYDDVLAIIREPNEYRLRLRNKNAQHVNLARRYVSSEVTNSQELSSN